MLCHAHITWAMQVAHSQMQTVEAFEAFTSASEATKNFTFEDFAWACDMLQTRAFGMPILQGPSCPVLFYSRTSC